MKTTQATKRTADEATYLFDCHDQAWSFMRECQAAGLQPGWPQALAVRVTIRTWMDRELADGLAIGGKVVRYLFAS